MDRAIFETYVRTQLAPTLEKGDIVILDNLPAHKSPAAEQAIRERGARLIFLPPYSPDLNPIEMAFAKLKAHLRAMAIRTIDELWKAIGQPTCKTSSTPTTSPEDSKPSKASPPMNSSAKPGLHSPRDSQSARSSKRRDETDTPLLKRYWSFCFFLANLGPRLRGHFERITSDSVSQSINYYIRRLRRRWQGMHNIPRT